MKKGLLLINLGTPDSTQCQDIKKYLKEFLNDSRVIDLPQPLRYLLVNCLIVPFRSAKTAKAYQSIWTSEGSPLLSYSQQLVKKLQASVGEKYAIALGMRYGSPSIESAFEQLKECASITILPLYPQYSSAATGSALEKTLEILAKQTVIPSLSIIRDFYQHPSYIKAQSQIISEYLSPEHYLLFSYHGVPERHLHRSGCITICPEICHTVSNTNQGCYKAQCYQTSNLLAQQLQRQAHEYRSSFQSRLGKTPWIRPYTDEVLQQLAAQGIKKLAICCPSFVTDCLETIEEIGLRAQQQWQQLGGTELLLIPSLNTHSTWIDAILDISQFEKN